jgi:hypothetical protein
MPPRGSAKKHAPRSADRRARATGFSPPPLLIFMPQRHYKLLLLLRRCCCRHAAICRQRLPITITTHFTPIFSTFRRHMPIFSPAFSYAITPFSPLPPSRVSEKQQSASAAPD